MGSLEKYYDILELGDGASLLDVKKAYSRLKRLYSSESIATSPLEDELSHDELQVILGQIEEAYRNISDSLKGGEGREPVHEADMREYIAGISSFSGKTLREIREARGIALREVAVSTKVGSRYLEYIEGEDFKKLPAEIYIKGFVSSYAEYLSLDPKRVAEDIINRYRAWQKDENNRTHSFKV